MPVDLHVDEMGGTLPAVIYYPLFAAGAGPEVIRQYKQYRVQKVHDVRAEASPTLGITGVVYEIDIEVNRRQTSRTVLWTDEEKWYVEEKVR